MTPFEGVVEDFEPNEIPEEYFSKPAVPGLIDVETGYRVAVPTTVYNTSGDDASGVAGVLMPSGDFIAAAQPRKRAQYWEFDETFFYERVLDEEGNPIRVTDKYGDEYFRVRGNSWTEGEVVWDGAVTGSINQSTLDGDGEDLLEERQLVKRRAWDVNLTPERPSTGELWLNMKKGTERTGTTEGQQHLVRVSHSENSWDTFGDRREAA